MLSLDTYSRGIDWRLDMWTPKSVQNRLLGERPYLQHENARNPKGGYYPPVLIERSILRRWGDITGKPGKFGYRWHHHLASYIRELIPGTWITPTMMDALRVIEDAIAGGREMVNLIGNKNSGKTAIMSRLALALVSVFPEWTVCRIAAPYKNAATATIWGELTDCFRRMCDKWHPDKMIQYLDGAEKIGQRCNLVPITERSERHGHVELIGVDQTGKFQGAKAVDSSKGFFLLMADEVGVFPSETFLDILSNVTGNENFLGITGCNFRRIDRMEGKLCKPEGRKYEDLDIERDWLWLSDYNSVTMRIDGHKCPNVMAKRVIFPFLLTERKRESMEKQHGLHGPKYLEQVRSFPNTSMAEYFVLRRDELDACRVFDDAVIMDHHTVKVAAGDPGLGGGDDCTFGAAEFGRAQVLTSNGTYESLLIFRPIEAIQVVPIDTLMVCDEAWAERVQRVAMSPVVVAWGQKVSPEEQVAVQYAEHLLRLGIPASHFAYDASMRGSVTHAMATFVGLQASAIDFGAPASSRVQSDGQPARDLWTNLRTEMYFGLANLVRSGQMRDGDMFGPAFDEVCSHQWDHRGQKQRLESKKEYKARNEGHSPNHADCAVLLVEAARSHGMRFGGSRSPGRHRSPGQRGDLRGIKAFQAHRGKRLIKS